MRGSYILFDLREQEVAAPVILVVQLVGPDLVRNTGHVSTVLRAWSRETGGDLVRCAIGGNCGVIGIERARSQSQWIVRTEQPQGERRIGGHAVVGVRYGNPVRDVGDAATGRNGVLERIRGLVLSLSDDGLDQCSRR